MLTIERNTQRHWKNDSLLRVPFSVKSKDWKICVDRAAYFFLFFGRAADNRNEWERSEHQKTRFRARAREMIICENKQKKNFRFFGIAWAEPRFSVRLVTTYSPNGKVLWLRNGFKKSEILATRAFFRIYDSTYLGSFFISG